MEGHPIIKRIPVSAHRYGKDISRDGRWLYGAYSGDRLICVAASAPEARRKYAAVWSERLTPQGKRKWRAVLGE